MKSKLNEGEYVFCCLDNVENIDSNKIIGTFKEKEGITVIISKKEAISLGLSYSFVAAWITLTIHSSLEGVGLTATFSNALNKKGISCNVIAGYYHDHIFVKIATKDEAMKILNNLSKNNQP